MILLEACRPVAIQIEGYVAGRQERLYQLIARFELRNHFRAPEGDDTRDSHVGLAAALDVCIFGQVPLQIAAEGGAQPAGGAVRPAAKGKLAASLNADVNHGLQQPV